MLVDNKRDKPFQGLLPMRLTHEESQSSKSSLLAEAWLMGILRRCFSPNASLNEQFPP